MALTKLTTLLLIILFFSDCQAVIDAITMDNVDEILPVDKIGSLLNSSYLEIFNGFHQSSYQGIIWGSGLRAFVAIPVRLNHKKCPLQINVIFKIDTGAPITTLTEEVIQKLFEKCPQIQETLSDVYTVNIAGRQFQVSKSKSYYENVNILGANFMRQVNGRLIVNYSKDLPEKLQLQFDVNQPKDIEGQNLEQ